MYENHLLDADERDRLKEMDTSIAPKNAEAERRIIQMAKQMIGMRHKGYCGFAGTRRAGAANDAATVVHAMPSMTCMIPHHSEDVLYTMERLLELHRSSKCTELAYLAKMFRDEWVRFCEHQLGVKNNAAGCKRRAEIVAGLHWNEKWEWKIRLWCSMRGQTLFRTLVGTCNLKRALYFLSNDDDKVVRRKLQVIVAHQTCGNYKSWKKTRRGMRDKEEDYNKFMLELRALQATLDFEVVSLRETTKSVCTRPKSDNIPLWCGKQWSFSAMADAIQLFCEQPAESEKKFEEIVQQRPGKLPIGEGKAENQMHAMEFARSSVVQAVDMNQYISFDNACHVPYVLCRYFLRDGADFVPQFRVVGFPEHTYTRSLSTVGECMGMAEFAFVRIVQRVLSNPLGVRLHYGHPDFIDSYWVYTRGGPSKASKVTNVSEDVFLGLRLLLYSERIGYTEVLNFEKGRESTLGGSAKFHAKVSQGAAQQIKSRDVYVLNQMLPAHELILLYHGTLAFYVNNALITVSFVAYVYAMVLFALAHVSYEQLGQAGNTAAVPWLIQVGFVQMVPVFVELCMERGLIDGPWHFVKYSLPSVFFFLFHIGTDSYYFL
eukprot:TRINITY_DN4969_c0_g1_i2.p1 TRINITY_DN4969_c0_g1~~TRINITY_DN4969_c0_g1_i2.p1  ORF type:complete len:684 (-),score=212.85 TRINITY_DN4969_c0_g1_i2:2150-3955(-)